MTARVPSPSAAAASTNTLQHRPMRRGVADDAVVRAALAHLELRLDQGHDRRRRPVRSVDATGPRTSASEMNETSITARSIGSPRVARSSVRALVRSWTTTRGSRATRSASCPARRRRRGRGRAPRWSRTSVKPPVEAPASRQTSPAGSIPKASSAAAQLVAAAAARTARARSTAIGRSPVDEIAGLPVEPGRIARAGADLAGQDQRLGAGRDCRPGRDRRRAGPDGRA